MTPIKDFPVLVTPASRPTFEHLLIAKACYQGFRPLSRDPHIIPYGVLPNGLSFLTRRKSVRKK